MISRTPKDKSVWLYENMPGRRYVVLSTGLMKINASEWIPSVTYQSTSNDTIYTRDEETFLQKFQPL